MTYCLAAWCGDQLVANPTGLNTAQIGGHIGNLMEDCTAIIVRNEQTQRIVLRYDSAGVSRTAKEKK